MAIKNSIAEQNEEDFSNVLEMEEFHPTEEEFKDPFAYFESLFRDEDYKYGCIKVIPPESF